MTAWSPITLAPPLLRAPAAVDRQRRAGHRRGAVAAQEHGQRGDLLRRREIEHRLLLADQIVARLLRRDPWRLAARLNLLLHQRRQHPARTDRVAGHAVI